MTIAREEIFGPVLSILPYKDEAERFAWPMKPSTAWRHTSSPATFSARRVAAEMRAGNVFINYPASDTAAPFGGYKQSGRPEYGKWAIDDFTEIKAVIGYQAAA